MFEDVAHTLERDNRFSVNKIQIKKKNQLQYVVNWTIHVEKTTDLRIN